MTNGSWSTLLLAVVLLVLFAVLGVRPVAGGTVHEQLADQRPLRFERNAGQAAGGAQFLARGDGYALLLEPHRAVLALRAADQQQQAAVAGRRVAPASPRLALVGWTLAGAAQQATLTGEGDLKSSTHHLSGKASSPSHIPTFARVRARNAYAGVDVVYYGKGRQLEYDFVVAPGADPSVIELAIEGADAVEVDDRGRLLIDTAAGTLVQHAPITYQMRDGAREPVDSRYTLASNRVRFELGKYDRTRELVIDPVVSYAEVCGGMQEDRAQSIAIDAQGNAYICGQTFSADFLPSPNGFDGDLGPAPVDGQVGTVVAWDAFVAKYSATGQNIYTTYLGGTNNEFAWDIAVDAQGNAYVVGQTFSMDFPTTPNAFQAAPFSNGSPLVGDGFVTKLDPTGSRLVYSTYLGDADAEREQGSVGTVTAADAAVGIAIDAQGNAYITGETNSPLFPTTPGAFDTRFGPEPVEGQLGGVVGGADAFACKLDADGENLLYSTFLGGVLDDYGNGIAIDAQGNAYITGLTRSSDFPTTPGAFQTQAFEGALPGVGEWLGDAYVTKLNPSGSALVYSTFLGDADVEREPDPRYGSVTGRDFGMGIAIDAQGNAYIVGATFSPFFPTTDGAYDRTLDEPGQDGQSGDISSSDAFVTKLNAAGSGLLYSTYLGGDGTEFGNDIAIDAQGNAYIVGSTTAFDGFPDTERNIPKQGYFNATVSDAFLTKLAPSGNAIDFSFRFGGTSSDDAQGVALGRDGSVCVAGYSFSHDFMSPNYDPDAQFVDVSGAFAPSDGQGYVVRFEDDAVVLPPVVSPGVCPVAGFAMISLTLAGLHHTRRRPIHVTP